MAFSTLFLFSLPILLQFFSGTNSATLTIINNCNYNIWPAILSNSGSPPLSVTGFALGPRDSQAITVPSSWSGRLWGRTQCAADTAGKFTCLTGDCGSSAVECGGGKLSPPVTTAEFTLTDGGPGSYLVSVVDGYNLPVMVVPQGGTGPGNCGTVGCVMDSNSNYFPKELRVTSGTGNDVVAIKSACGGASEYTTGPANCNPNNSYSDLFKRSCPQAQTSANDKSMIFTCGQSADYVVHFCPSGYPSTRGLTGDIPQEDDDGSDGLFGDKEVNTKFAIGIGVAVLVLGVVLIIWIWRRYLKSECELHPCTCTCCNLFSCSICVDK